MFNAKPRFPNPPAVPRTVLRSLFSARRLLPLMAIAAFALLTLTAGPPTPVAHAQIPSEGIIWEAELVATHQGQ